MEVREIEPSGPVEGSVRPPGSKSITNRALVCAALAQGESTLSGCLDSEDTRLMAEALRQLGIPIGTGPQPDVLRVHGQGGRLKPGNHDLFVGNSGTTVRFLTAFAPLGAGTIRLDGVPRMRARPISPLLEALKQLGADARDEAGTGCPPVSVRAEGLPGGTARVGGDISSQYLSGLLMAAPYAQSEVRIHVEGELVSQSYVEMTLAVMRSFGVQVARPDLLSFEIPSGQRYSAIPYEVEPDASAASYFFAAAAITGGNTRVEGLGRESLQGDVAFAGLLEQMGCEVHYSGTDINVVGRPLRGIDVDMNDISDTVQTMAAVALFAEGATRIRGVEHIRHKESNRIEDLARELRKLGASVEEYPDGLAITPGPLHAATLDTYDDHRMAMSLALAGLRVPGVKVRDPACVAKTYPRFFEDLATITRPPNRAKRLD